MCSQAGNHCCGAQMLSVLVFLTPTAVTWPFCLSQAESSVRVGGSRLEPWPQHSAWPLEGTRSGLSV